MTGIALRHRDGHDFMRFPEPCSQRVCGLADRIINNGLETHKIMTVPIYFDLQVSGDAADGVPCESLAFAQGAAAARHRACRRTLFVLQVPGNAENGVPTAD